MVAHLNKLLGKWGDSSPINVSLYYNESENFQVVGTRYDIYGNEIPAASGTTKDRGIMLSTKDDRFWCFTPSLQIARRDRMIRR